MGTVLRISAFADEAGGSMEEQIQALQDNDLKYVELRAIADKKNVMDAHDDELKSVKRLLDKNDIRLSALGSPIGKVSITCDFESYLKVFERALDIADILCTDKIRMFSFYIPEGEAPEDYREEVMERLKIMADISEQRGITLMMENEGRLYGDIGDRCLDIMETVDSPFLRMLFDPANFIASGVRPYEDCLGILKPYISHFHVKDATFSPRKTVPAGAGEGKVDKTILELVDSGYNGFLTVEPHLGRTFELPAPERFKLAVDSLKELLNTLGIEYC